MRALFRCRFGRWCLFFYFQLVDASDEEKYSKGHYEEADDGIYENAIVDCDRTSLLSLGKRSKRSRSRPCFQDYEKIREVHITQ